MEPLGALLFAFSLFFFCLWLIYVNGKREREKKKLKRLKRTIPACKDCKHLLKQNGVECCTTQIVSVDQVTGITSYQIAAFSRSYWTWYAKLHNKFFNGSALCDKSGILFEPMPLPFSTQPIPSMPPQKPTREKIADILIKESGFDEDDALGMADDILKVING